MRQERYLEKIYVQACTKPSDVIAIKDNCLCEYYHIRCFSVTKTFYCNSLKKELSSADDPEYVYTLNVIQNPTFKHFIISLHNILGHLFSVDFARWRWKDWRWRPFLLEIYVSNPTPRSLSPKVQPQKTYPSSSVKWTILFISKPASFGNGTQWIYNLICSADRPCYLISLKLASFCCNWTWWNLQFMELLCGMVNNLAIILANSLSKNCLDSVDMYLQNAPIMKENMRQVVEIMESVLRNDEIASQFHIRIVTYVPKVVSKVDLGPMNEALLYSYKGIDISNCITDSNIYIFTWGGEGEFLWEFIYEVLRCNTSWSLSVTTCLLLFIHPMTCGRRGVHLCGTAANKLKATGKVLSPSQCHLFYTRGEQNLANHLQSMNEDERHTFNHLRERSPDFSFREDDVWVDVPNDFMDIDQVLDGTNPVDLSHEGGEFYEMVEQCIKITSK